MGSVYRMHREQGEIIEMMIGSLRKRKIHTVAREDGCHSEAVCLIPLPPAPAGFRAITTRSYKSTMLSPLSQSRFSITATLDSFVLYLKNVYIYKNKDHLHITFNFFDLRKLWFSLADV